jgi:hypothetical protein
MTAVQLAKRCGNRELGKLAKRLKCARCGVKAAHIVVLPPV